MYESSDADHYIFTVKRAVIVIIFAVLLLLVMSTASSAMDLFIHIADLFETSYTPDAP